MNSLTHPSHSDPLRISILLLAAGEGSRLGFYPKALLKRANKTLIEHFCHAIGGLSLSEIVVVTGFYAAEIEAELVRLKANLGLPLRIHRNSHPERGQPSSVRLGLESLKQEFDVLIVALSDQPEISFQDLQALIGEFEHCINEQEIVLPMVQGIEGVQRGNPVLFSSKAVKAILSHSEMVCRPYMDANPLMVRKYLTSNPAYLLDVDTPEDIQRLGLQK